MSHLLSTAQLAVLAPVSWLTSCSRWLMKKSWLLGFRGCFPINMNSPWSSCNIRPGPAFIQQATRSFVCNTQEEMKRVNSPFGMLHSIMGGTKSPMKGTSILGSQKHICLPSPYITALCSVSLISVSCFTVNETVQISAQPRHGCPQMLYSGIKKHVSTFRCETPFMYFWCEHYCSVSCGRVRAWCVRRLFRKEWTKASKAKWHCTLSHKLNYYCYFYLYLKIRMTRPLLYILLSLCTISQIIHTQSNAQTLLKIRRTNLDLKSHR